MRSFSYFYYVIMSPYHFELHHLRAFMVVAEHLHFRKAASLLHITQPGLSRTIKALEESLGVELFVRSTRQVSLTQAGEVFRIEVEKMFVHLDKGVMLAKEVSLGTTGYLKIAYNDFAVQELLPKLIQKFKENYPAIKTKLIFMTTQEQIDAIQKGQIDIGLGFSYTDSEKPDLIDSLPLVVDKPIVLLPKNHPLVLRDKVTLAELVNEGFVVGTSKEWRIWRQYFSKLFEPLDTQPLVVEEASSVSGIMSLAAVKNCSAFVSTALSKFTHSDLQPVSVELAEDMPEAFITMMWNRGSDNTALPHFLDIAKSMQDQAFHLGEKNVFN